MPNEGAVKASYILSITRFNDECLRVKRTLLSILVDGVYEM